MLCWLRTSSAPANVTFAGSGRDPVIVVQPIQGRVGRRRGLGCPSLFRRPPAKPRLRDFHARGFPVIQPEGFCRVGRPAWMAL
jgi:hypothetical protein